MRSDEQWNLRSEQLANRIASWIEWVQDAPVPMDYDPHWFKPEGSYPMPRPPAWWLVRHERQFTDFDGLRREVLGHLGIKEAPRDSDADGAGVVWATLKELAATQLSQGDELHLPLKAGIDQRTGGPMLQDVVVQRGTHLAERQLQRRIDQPQSSPNENAAAFLYDAMAHIAHRIGCSEDDALSYLLWGEIPQGDWISITPVSTRGALQILVRHPQVPPADVAAAYRAVRDTLWGPRRRGRKEGQLRVAEIVEELSAGKDRIDWEKVQRELQERYGIRYKNPKSLAQTWRNHKKSMMNEFSIGGSKRATTSSSEKRPKGDA